MSVSIERAGDGDELSYNGVQVDVDLYVQQMMIEICFETLSSGPAALVIANVVKKEGFGNNGRKRTAPCALAVTYGPIRFTSILDAS